MNVTSYSTESDLSDTELNKADEYEKKNVMNYRCNSNTHSGNCTLTEFFGNVFGRAVSYAYKDHMHDSDFTCGADSVGSSEFRDPKDINPDCLRHSSYADDSEQNSDADIDMFYTSDIEEPTDTNHSCLDSEVDVEMPDDYVYNIDRDQCQCYKSLKENENGRLFNTPHLLASTVNALSSSNIPSSGTFNAKLVRPVSYVTLPSDWLNIPLKGKDENTPKSFSGNYATLFREILKAFNPFCCFVFKRNYIKRDNSRKTSCPYWRGTVVCKHEDVVSHLTIQDREQNILRIEFIGDVKHDITKPKATKMLGEQRATAIQEYERTNTTPSKYHRDKLVELPSEAFQAGNRSGVGVSHSTIKNIRAAAKKKTQFDKNLCTAISCLQQSVSREDEEDALKVGHMWRKLFGYIQHFNLTNNINLVLFNEASVRVYHELAKYDIVYIDATGKLFSAEGLRDRGRLLYYAMVVRHPYAKYPPIPIVEYITSCHTTDSIRVMLRTLKEKEKEVYPNVSCYPTPAVVMTDFSMAIINACIRECANENVEDYLTRGFNIINGHASREDAEKTIFHVCAAHILKLNKFHVKKLHGKGETGSSKVHIAMRFFGRLLYCSTLQEMTNFVSLGYYIFKSKYDNPTLNRKLEAFSKAIHDFTFPIDIDSDQEDFIIETPNDDAESLTETL
jgi:hypothetical protein